MTTTEGLLLGSLVCLASFFQWRIAILTKDLNELAHSLTVYVRGATARMHKLDRIAKMVEGE